MLNLRNFLIQPETKRVIESLENEIVQNSPFWQRSDVVADLQNTGFTFNVVDDFIFDRIFLMPCSVWYRASNADQLRVYDLVASQVSDELKRVMLRIHHLVERLSRTLFIGSHVPGYTLTSKAESARTRIPIHIHKGRSLSDGEDEMTFSLALRLTEGSSPKTKIRFYEPQSSSEDRVQEDLIHSTDFVDVSIHKAVMPFLFSAKSVPHTVFFSDDLVLWAVFNGVPRPIELNLGASDILAI